MQTIFDSTGIHGGWKLLACFAACCFALMAQSERGSIRGTVEDASGAVIAGATVTAINAGTGVRTSTKTAEAGNFNIPQLPPGNYTVEVEQMGFKKAIQENLTVEVGAVAALNLRLEAGQATESVTVAAAAPQLKTETTEVRRPSIRNRTTTFH